MKKYYISAFLVVISILSYGQQRPQYTQYMINPFLLNPAVSGTEDYADIRAGYRNQWTGFDGAPQTMYLSGHVDIGKHLTKLRSKKKNDGFHGVGGILTNDIIGPTNTINLSAAYSYHLTIAKKMYASLGLSAGFQQYSLDATKLHTWNTLNTESLLTSNSSFGMGDISLGGWVYGESFYAGASMTQVAPGMTFSGARQLLNYKMAHHYFVMGGVRIPLDHNYTFIPSLCFKGVSPAPMSFDINAKIRYQDMLWAAISYRSTDAAAVLMGVIINNMFDVSYSYDYTLSDIGKYTSTGGSHEIVVGYRLRPNGQVYCPSHLW